jgi:hypothetical protein
LRKTRELVSKARKLYDTVHSANTLTRPPRAI